MTIKIAGKVRIILQNDETGDIEKDTGWIDNLCPTIGRSALAAILAGNNTKSNAGKITYCAVGTGIATPTISGIKLSAELARKFISPTTTSIDNSAIIQAFFIKSEANGTLTELGMFGEEATATADTGTMFQWISILPNIVKDNTQTMLITSTIQISYL
jgi:hypothetical protein